MTSTFTDSIRNSSLSVGNNYEAKLEVGSSLVYPGKEPQIRGSGGSGSYPTIIHVIQPLLLQESWVPHL